MQIAQIILAPCTVYSGRMDEPTSIQRRWTLAVGLQFGLPGISLYEEHRVKAHGEEDYGGWFQSHDAYFELSLEWKWGWEATHEYYDGEWFLIKRGPFACRWHY